jgi:DNA-binding transcriptional regulator of glucitol operon
LATRRHPWAATWLSKRAFVLHVGLVLVVSVCGFAGWWQIDRALSGNLLSYGYAVEWPVFAVIAVVFWWQFIHTPPAGQTDAGLTHRPRPTRSGGSATVVARLVRRAEEEGPYLRRYNEGLSSLAASGRAKTWRNPRGLP